MRRLMILVVVGVVSYLSGCASPTQPTLPTATLPTSQPTPAPLPPHCLDVKAANYDQDGACIYAAPSPAPSPSPAPTPSPSPSPAPTPDPTPSPTPTSPQGSLFISVVTWANRATLNVPVTLTAEAQNATGTVTYAWQFSDGTTDTGSVVTHTFTTLGTGGFIVTATDAQSHMARTNAMFAVVGPPVLDLTLACVPATTGSPTSCTVNAKWRLVTTTITRVDWTWGDGSQTLGGAASETHTYADVTGTSETASATVTTSTTDGVELGTTTTTFTIP